MNIVIIDGYTLHSHDIDRHYFDSLGTVVFHDRTPPERIIERCQDASIVVTNKVPFSAETLAALPKLNMIAVAATGYNIIDIAAAKRQGIVVCNVPTYGTASVAQHIFALLLELSNHVGRNSHAVKQGAWHQAEDWCFSAKPLIELADKTLGIVGLGRIGLQTARIAQAFGMKVCYHARSPKQHDDMQALSLEDLFTTSDFVALCCPATAENSGFVNKALLRKMKPTAYLINASRGQLIVESDLATALHEGVLAGAALDVLSQEPPSADNPLIQAPNCLITPHNAWMSLEARQRIAQTVYQNIEGFLHGKPLGQVL